MKADPTMSKRRKFQREKDLTSRYLSGNMDEDRMESGQRFTSRNKNAQQNKILKTTAMRAEVDSQAVDPESLPIGQVIQVFSLLSEVESEGVTRLCVVRKTLNKVSDTSIVVGDRVRFRDTEMKDDSGKQQGVIEQILPRDTVLTRADSFKAIEQHPIVANAEQMLIVASVNFPKVKWGLIDRMIVAARAGGLRPVICLNKIDLKDESIKEFDTAVAALSHYATMDIPAIQTSVEQSVGLDDLTRTLKDRVTVLAGHSGVGKSSLIRAVQPELDLRVGAVSGFNNKGRHTTTSARRYDLAGGGAVIDTPGVKLFGLWNVSRDNLEEFFPDIASGTAPQWRIDSYERIAESLP